MTSTASLARYRVGDLDLTRIGYGAMQLAGPHVFGPPKDRDAAIRVLRTAVDLGINHIDTSDYYGPYVTNEIIRDALAPYPDDLHIVTKVGARRDEQGGWPPARTPAELREGWSYFWQTTWLWVVVVAFCFLNAIQSGAIFILGPTVALETFGEQGWGLVLSAESAGLILMTIVMLRVPLQRPLLLGMLGISTLGLPILMLGVRPELAVMIVAMFGARRRRRHRHCCGIARRIIPFHVIS